MLNNITNGGGRLTDLREEFQLRNDMDKLMADLGFTKEQLQTLKETTLDEDDVPEWLKTLNVYTQPEVDARIAELPTNDEIDARINNMYRNLNYLFEGYDETIEREYTLFRGDCWTINNNF